MKKKWLFSSLLFLIVTGLFFGGLVFAQGESDSSKNKIQGKFITKVSNILGLDEEVVVEAFNQAIIEIHSEKNTEIDLGIQSKIDSGMITEEEGSNWRAKLLNNNTPTFKGFLDKNKRNFKNKPYMNKFGLHKSKGANKKFNIEEAVKSGKLTQEQVDAKLQGFKNKPYMNKFGLHKGKGANKEFNIEEVIKKLEEAVKSGKLTQEQADARLGDFQKFKGLTR